MSEPQQKTGDLLRKTAIGSHQMLRTCQSLGTPRYHNQGCKNQRPNLPKTLIRLNWWKTLCALWSVSEMGLRTWVKTNQRPLRLPWCLLRYQCPLKRIWPCSRPPIRETFALIARHRHCVLQRLSQTWYQGPLQYAVIQLIRFQYTL